MAMRRLVVATVADALRSILVLAVVGLTIGGAWFIGTNSFNLSSTGCEKGGSLLVCKMVFHGTRAPWQIPVAVAVALAGLGLAAFLASWRRTRRAERRLPMSVEWPVRRIAA